MISSILRRLRVVSLVGLVLAACADAPLRGDDAIARYFDGLRQRRLFTLAEGYAIDRLARERLAPAARVDWTIELARTYAEHGRFVSGDEQRELWRKAEATLADEIATYPANPRRPQLEAQIALVRAGQAEFLAAQAALLPDDRPAAEAADEALLAAIDRLRQSEAALAAAVGKARPNDPDGLAPATLRALLDTARLSRATLLIERARLHPRASPDRMSAALDAEEVLKRLAGGIPGEPLTWTSRVLLAEAARLRGDARLASSLLASIEKDSPPADVTDRLVAVQAETLLDSRQPDDAASLLVRYQKQRGGLPGELELLKTRTIVALWRVARDKGDAALASELLQQAETQVARIERDTGGWWAWRSRLAFETAVEHQKYGDELAPLVRQARAAWSARRTDDALARYEQAAKAAVRANLPDVAVEMAFTRGSILLQAGRPAEAAADFQAIYERFPENAKAAEAHLLRAYCLGRIHEADPSADRLRAYTASLEAHRARFASDPTSVEAAWMLAVLHERGSRHDEALPLYAQIPADHIRGPEAHVALARCFEAILARRRETNEPAAEWERRAVEQLLPLAESYPDEGPLSRPQAEVALRFARLSLNLGRPDYARADGLLARVLDAAALALAAGETNAEPPERGAPADPASADPDAAAWSALRRTARQLRIVSLAGQRRWTDAEKLVQSLKEARPAEVLAVLDGLAQFGRSADGPTRIGLAELQLRTAESLLPRRSSMPPDEQRRLDECLAQAYVASGQSRKAIALYEQLLAATPKDATLRRTLAELLIVCGDAACLQTSRGHWKQLETTSRPGSPDWLYARYRNAWCAHALRDDAEARKLIRVTRLLYPELGGKDLAAKFAELERSAK